MSKIKTAIKSFLRSSHKNHKPESEHLHATDTPAKLRGGGVWKQALYALCAVLLVCGLLIGGAEGDESVSLLHQALVNLAGIGMVALAVWILCRTEDLTPAPFPQQRGEEGTNNNNVQAGRHELAKPTESDFVNEANTCFDEYIDQASIETLFDISKGILPTGWIKNNPDPLAGLLITKARKRLLDIYKIDRKRINELLAHDAFSYLIPKIGNLIPAPSLQQRGERENNHGNNPEKPTTPKQHGQPPANPKCHRCGELIDIEIYRNRKAPQK